MPATPHVEKHFTATDTVRDIIIGMSDGLTVPFALAAGLSGAVSNTAIVITAGLAEIAAGAISMGLGGYLAARTDFEHYATERQREQDETERIPEQEEQEVSDILQAYGLAEEEAAPVVRAIRSDKRRWIDFMMQFELGLEEPNPKRALWSALTIAFSYIGGGLIPLAPYILLNNITRALWASVGLTLIALFIFGSIKGHYTSGKSVRGGIQTVLIGGLAASAAFLIARWIG